ncbi:hypothetical protein ACA910_004861 [Epithemia clementina (nom. ined.)]
MSTHINCNSSGIAQFRQGSKVHMGLDVWIIDGPEAGPSQDSPMGKKRKHRIKSNKVTGNKNETSNPDSRDDHLLSDEEALRSEPKRLKHGETTTRNDANVASKRTAEEVDDTVEATLNLPNFPFPTEPDDHCESPKEAYMHIAAMLNEVQPRKQQSLRIYDPYYCDGAVERNFNQLGFLNVYNKKEDCYHVWEKGDLPLFDVLVSNPPYSGDHIEKLLHFVFSPAFGSRPWFLLLPQWVHKKEFFLAALRKRTDACPFYIVPRKRYVYLPPRGFREAKTSDTHKKSSPFVSMCECDLARSKNALRDLRRKKR